jgi:hypothetical protein
MSRPRPSTAIVFGVLLSPAVLAAFPVPAAEAGPPADRFAAIAVSPRTGRYGYCSGAASLRDAETVARANTGDLNAEVVVEVKNGWVALAASDTGGYAATWSARSAQDAATRALLECAPYGGRCQVVAWASAR